MRTLQGDAIGPGGLGLEAGLDRRRPAVNAPGAVPAEWACHTLAPITGRCLRAAHSRLLASRMKGSHEDPTYQEGNAPGPHPGGADPHRRRHRPDPQYRLLLGQLLGQLHDQGQQAVLLRIVGPASLRRAGPEAKAEAEGGLEVLNPGASRGRTHGLLPLLN